MRRESNINFYIKTFFEFIKKRIFLKWISDIYKIREESDTQTLMIYRTSLWNDSYHTLKTLHIRSSTYTSHIQYVLKTFHLDMI